MHLTIETSALISCRLERHFFGSFFVLTFILLAVCCSIDRERRAPQTISPQTATAVSSIKMAAHMSLVWSLSNGAGSPHDVDVFRGKAEHYSDRGHSPAWTQPAQDLPQGRTCRPFVYNMGRVAFKATTQTEDIRASPRRTGGRYHTFHALDPCMYGRGKCRLQLSKLIC